MFPNNLINKCPAIILAVSRTANLPGRIMFLIVSIKTINGIRRFGVPFGTKCANIEFVLLNHPKIIILIHNGNAIANENARCLELVKIYGINPIKLLIKMNKNKEIVINVIPSELTPKSNLNSLCNFWVILRYNVLIRLGKIQYE